MPYHVFLLNLLDYYTNTMYISRNGDRPTEKQAKPMSASKFQSLSYFTVVGWYVGAGRQFRCTCLIRTTLIFVAVET